MSTHKPLIHLPPSLLALMRDSLPSSTTTTAILPPTFTLMASPAGTSKARQPSDDHLTAAYAADEKTLLGSDGSSNTWKSPDISVQEHFAGFGNQDKPHVDIDLNTDTKHRGGETEKDLDWEAKGSVKSGWKTKGGQKEHEEMQPIVERPRIRANVPDDLRALMRKSLVPPPPSTKAIQINRTTSTKPKTEATTPVASIFAATSTGSTHREPGDAQEQRLTLLDLPDEILVQILTPLLKHPHPMPVTPRWDEMPCETRHVDYRVLHTCTRLYALALPLYYTLNTFSLSLGPFHLYPQTHTYPHWPHSTGQTTATAYLRTLYISARPFSNWKDLAMCLRGFAGGQVEEVVLDVRCEGEVEGEWWDAKRELGWDVQDAGKGLAGLVRGVLAMGAAAEEEGGRVVKDKPKRDVKVGVGDIRGWKARDAERGWSFEDVVLSSAREGCGRVLGSGEFAFCEVGVGEVDGEKDNGDEEVVARW